MTDVPVIDRTVLDQLLASFGGDAGFLGEMLDTFFEDSPQQLASMQDGLAREDAELVRRAAHSLKSNSANFGALVLSARCKELEMLARRGSLAGGVGLLGQIKGEYEQAHAALAAIRAGD